MISSSLKKQTHALFYHGIHFGKESPKTTNCIILIEAQLFCLVQTRLYFVTQSTVKFEFFNNENTILYLFTPLLIHANSEELYTKKNLEAKEGYPSVPCLHATLQLLSRHLVFVFVLIDIRSRTLNIKNNRTKVFFPSRDRLEGCV